MCMFYQCLVLNTSCSCRDVSYFLGGGCTMQHMQHTNWEVIILLADMDSRPVGFERLPFTVFSRTKSFTFFSSYTAIALQIAIKL